MKILISGAGIAGNALAFWLSKLGHDVTVIERASSLRTAGLQIDLRGHGIEVMKRMGLEQEFRAKGAPEQGLQWVDSSGRRRGYFPANKSGQGEQSFTSEIEIMRGDMCSIMYEAAKARTKYVFGTSVEKFTDNGNSVEVQFADGKKDTFDLLVGADGQWSRTRKSMLGSDQADGFYPLKGVYIAYFNIPRPIKEGEEYIATIFMAPGKRGVMTRRQSPHELQIYLGCTTNSERLKNARRGDEQKEALAEIMKGAGWQIEDMVKALKDVKEFYCERLGIVKLESWSKGRVVLVGDAAYCPSANTGMGTTSGVVGAYILAGEIGRYCGGDDAREKLTTALKAYETKFRPFMDQVQKGVLEDEGMGMSSSAFGIAIMNIIVGVASFFKVNIGKYMLKEGVENWNLPDYEGMDGRD
ncbi:hypothetical protein EG329_002238 [Mollisiaceae sp. DMI_Dod_QoI]|nr:hypothetical protein EG329_002238 [Helotiales sp. DMI_Dod_QoI]